MGIHERIESLAVKQKQLNEKNALRNKKMEDARKIITSEAAKKLYENYVVLHKQKFVGAYECRAYVYHTEYSAEIVLSGWKMIFNFIPTQRVTFGRTPSFSQNNLGNDWWLEFHNGYGTGSKRRYFDSFNELCNAVDEKLVIALATTPSYSEPCGH